MKHLLLLAALTSPALAAPTIEHFGDWTVETDTSNNIVIAFSFPIDSSARLFEFSCDNSHLNCRMADINAGKCYTSGNFYSYFRLHSVADRPQDLDFKSTFVLNCVNHRWVDYQQFDLKYLQQMFHYTWFPILSIKYGTAGQVTNYSTNGAAAAADKVMGTFNNFSE
ncbi:hypothetical protein D5018_02315 [Parashewanella curva]|uniref:Uncharacterized protein n=1 Tax=Parashewanella curva TaxID=2338552 RepID=A0A3L8Q2Z1_9GAMM|nr:hypothetical protein [Parashewanella curva]RLV61333.1 hypothetical protein D5018_02315 [Parashewanella curva]